MAKVAMQYSITHDSEDEITADGQTHVGVFTMRVNTPDGHVFICAGPDKMSAVILGMTRLAAYAHQILGDNDAQLHHVLVSEATPSVSEVEAIQPTLILLDDASNSQHLRRIAADHNG